MKTHLNVLAAAWVAIAATSFAQNTVRKPTRPIPAIAHVLIMSIDGLRPDLALRANMPTLRGMLQDGAYTFWAKTTASSITLPSHTSMVTGVSPDKHGIRWNSDLPLSKPVYPLYPTVMEMATKAGYVTAMVAGKSKLSPLNKPGTVTQVYAPTELNSAVDSPTVAAHAEKLIAAYKPDLLFVHFPDVDIAGHAHGWGSAQQIAAIERTDTQLKRVLVALDKAGLQASTLIMVSADHGGAGLTHGAEDARSRHIPWIVVGPSVKRGYDLTQRSELEVRTEDTAATAAYLLGLPQPRHFDGKPVVQAFESFPKGQ